MLLWFNGVTPRLREYRHPCIPPHSRSPTPAGYVPRAHRGPAQFYHQQFDTFRSFRSSLESGKIELFEDSIGGDPLNAIVKANLTSDLSERVHPRV